MMRGLVQTAEIEVARWLLSGGVRAALNNYDAQLGRSAAAVATFDSALIRLGTPRVSVRQAFAAAFNMLTGSDVRLVVSGGQVRVVRLGDVLQAEQASLATRRVDPAPSIAADLMRFGSAFVSGEAGKGIGAELAAILTQDRAAAPRDTAILTVASNSASAARTDTGLVGESQGAIDAASARLDAVRTWQEATRLDGTAARLEAIRETQRVRHMYEVALTRWAAAQPGGTW